MTTPIKQLNDENGNAFYPQTSVDAIANLSIGTSKISNSAVTTAKIANNAVTADKIYIQDLLDYIYPVGSIYMSVNNVSPQDFIGGTWVSWGKGRVPVGVDTTDSSFNTVEKTGGEKRHTLSLGEMPSHEHRDASWRCYDAGGWADRYGVQSGNFYTAITIGDTYTMGAGGSQSHNNLQPYITCYMWKRTS